MALSYHASFHVVVDQLEIIKGYATAFCLRHHHLSLLAVRAHFWKNTSSPQIDNHYTCISICFCHVYAKVDREERPDVDRVYMSYIQVLVNASYLVHP
jgi:hypothetical protein